MAAASFEELRRRDKALFTGSPYRLLFKIPVCSFAERGLYFTFWVLEKTGDSRKKKNRDNLCGNQSRLLKNEDREYIVECLLHRQLREFKSIS